MIAARISGLAKNFKLKRRDAEDDDDDDDDDPEAAAFAAAAATAFSFAPQIQASASLPILGDPRTPGASERPGGAPSGEQSPARGRGGGGGAQSERRRRPRPVGKRLAPNPHDRRRLFTRFG